MFLPDLRAELSQGDLIDVIEVWEEQDARVVVSRRVRAVVLSHDCEMDKKSPDRSRFLLIVEMRSPTDSGAPGNWGNIKEGKGWNALYVPTPKEGQSEGYLDFGRIHRVLKTSVQAGTRLASMSDDGREVLIYALTSYLLHEEIVP